MSSTFPNSETWRGIQGGEPLILSNQNKTMFQITHVYDSNLGLEDLLTKRRLPRFDSVLSGILPHYGCVIDTPKQQFIDSCTKQVGLITSTVGSVIMPAVLLIDKHGKPCSQRSKAGGYESGYKKVTDRDSWNEFLDRKSEGGWIVWAIEPHLNNQNKISNKGPVSTFKH